MSEFMDSLVERLPLHSALQKSDNQGRKVLDYTVGEFMDNHDVTELLEGMFLTSATGGYLDLWGRQYKVTRRTDETDDSYRERIIQESLGHLTTDYLQEVFGLTVYAYVSNFNPANNTLTSDNEYINSNGYMIFTDDRTIATLENKFVLDSNVHLRNCYGCLFYDSGVNDFVKSNWYKWNGLSISPSIEGVLLTNSAELFGTCVVLQDPHNRDLYNWSGEVIITFDVVEVTKVTAPNEDSSPAFQIFDTANPVNYYHCYLDENTEKVKCIVSSDSIEMYKDDVLVDSFDVELGNYAVSFSCWKDASVKWKNFKVMPND